MAPTSLLPKLLATILFLAAFYQLSTYKSAPDLTQPVPSALTDYDSSKWFPDAIKAPNGDSTDDDDSSHPSDSAESTKPPSPARDYTRTHIAYGQTQCMPHFNTERQQAAIHRNASCTKHTPFPSKETRRVAFASITTGEPINAYQRAILSQMFHAAVHDTSMHLLCDQLTDGTFNKIAFLLHLVMAEMLKPAAQRLEWIMWTDRDAIILDACRPLSSFLPPSDPAFDKIELIVNNDDSGLNNGIFLFKVSEWMLQYLNHVLAIRYFRPDADLTFAEQSAMEIIMREDEAKHRFAQVPWYWFNAYPDEDDSITKYRDNLEPDDLEYFRARKGDFIVHFAGDDGRSGRMPEWEDMIEQVGDVWAGDTRRDISGEITEYWEAWRNGALTAKQRTGEDEGSAIWRKQQVAERKKAAATAAEQEKEKEKAEGEKKGDEEQQDRETNEGDEKAAMKHDNANETEDQDDVKDETKRKE